MTTAPDFPLRILHLMAGAKDGGAETAFADTCIAMKEAGETIAVVTRSNNPERIERLKKAGIFVHVLPFGGPLDVYTAWKLRGIIRAFRPDIVQTWMSRAAQKVPRWSPRSGAPRYQVFSRLGGYYALKNFRATDYFIAITPAIRDWLMEQGVKPDRVRHINNFAETEPDAVAASRTAENTPDDATLLIALGRLHKAKAFDVLLDAMAMLPGVYLWIAGEGPERPALEAQIDRLALRDRVRLLGWRNDRAALLRAGDICVFPSRHEPFGTVFIQAWANRIPLVTTDADGPRQFVEDGKDGLIAPRENAYALAEQIQKIIADPDLEKDLIEQGFMKYEARFSKGRVLEAYQTFYLDGKTD